MSISCRRTALAASNTTIPAEPQEIGNERRRAIFFSRINTRDQPSGFISCGLWSFPHRKSLLTFRRVGACRRSAGRDLLAAATCPVHVDEKSPISRRNESLSPRVLVKDIRSSEQRRRHLCRASGESSVDNSVNFRKSARRSKKRRESWSIGDRAGCFCVQQEEKK